MGMAKLVMKNSMGENNSVQFNWTVGTESALDSSFFWGYLVTQVPGGFVASLYPANRIFGAAIAISSFLNLLVPGALKVDPIVDMGVQVLKGLVEVRRTAPFPIRFALLDSPSPSPAPPSLADVRSSDRSNYVRGHAKHVVDVLTSSSIGVSLFPELRK